jgi:hypothetical protein
METFSVLTTAAERLTEETLHCSFAMVGVKVHVKLNDGVNVGDWLLRIILVGGLPPPTPVCSSTSVCHAAATFFAKNSQISRY